MKKRGFSIIILFLILMPIISAEDFGYNYLEGELNVAQAINYTTISVNDSALWDGNPFSHLADTYVPYSGATSLVNLGNEDLLADLVWANDIQIWDDTLNADAILSMYTHDLSNSFVLQVTDAGSTDFYSTEQYQFRNGDNLFQIIHDMYTGTYLNIDVGNTFPEITSKDGTISFVDENLTTTGNITASYFFGDGSELTGIVHNNLAGLQGGGGEGSQYYHLNLNVFDSATGFLDTSSWGDNTLEIGSGINLLFDNGNITASLFNGINISNLGDTYVPYTGANANVDLGSYNITGNFLGNTSIWSRAGTNTFLTNVGDKVGIGTATPAYTLDINGSINIPSTTSAIEGVIMQDGSRLIHTYHGASANGYNLFVGKDSGNFGMVGTGISGSNNVGVGENSLKGLTTGYRNTGVGYNTLSLTNSGNRNTAVGYRALASLTTGSNNAVVGTENTPLLTTGSDTYAFGAYNLYRVTTGTGNIALGRSNLFSLKTGNHNIGIGKSVGLGVADSSNYNYNILIGYSTGSSLLTGADNNIILGKYAGQNITTGANNIMIGSYTNASSATASNEINIGNTIYGNMSSGNVGINTSTPQNKLNVIGDGNFTGNLTIGNKLTFKLGEFIDNLVDGWLRINGNLQVEGDLNVTGNYINNANTGITGNYSVGDCWMAYSGGIIYKTNCSAY